MDEVSAGFRAGRVRSEAEGRPHEIAYVEWGDPASPRAVVCVHGLTRQGRDFDFLARRLVADGFRVVCPDVAGRGLSDRLPRADLYGVPQYVADMTALMAGLGLDEVDWVGTSMGGLIGMAIAAMPGTPIRRLVLNDVGPFLPAEAIHAIGRNVLGNPPLHETFEDAEARLRLVYRTFGDLGDAGWRHIAEHSFVETPQGWRPHYDPAIGEAFRSEIADVSLWPLWDAISRPTLVLRGASSDLLPRETADEMTRRGPKARVVEIPGCGHAPALFAEDQIAVVAGWLGAAA